MKLPPDALARLRAYKAQDIQVGSVWWLPAENVRFFPGGKGRYCLVAGIEHTTGVTPGLIHIVPGSTKSGGEPKITISAGDAGLVRQTFFRFRLSGTVTVAAMVDDGRLVGALEPGRLSEIEKAVMASNRPALKRLWLP